MLENAQQLKNLFKSLQMENKLIWYEHVYKQPINFVIKLTK